MKESRLFRFRHLLTVLVLCAMSALVLSLNLKTIDVRKSNVEYRIRSLAEYQLKGSIDQYVNLASNWTSLLISNDGEISQEKFDEISARMWKQYDDPAIRCIQLAPKGVIQYAYPLQGFESAIDGDLFSGHRKEECEKARDTGLPTMNGPYELTQGGIACIIRELLYLSDENGKEEFWGFSIIVLNYPNMLSGVDFDAENRDYDYKISHISEKTGEEEVILQSTMEEFKEPVSVTFDVPNGEWTMSAVWRGGWITKDEMIGEGILVGLIVLLFALFINFYAKTRNAEKAIVSLINDSEEAMSVITPDGSEVLMANKAFRRLWGSRTSYVSGLSYAQFYENTPYTLDELVANGDTVVSSSNINTDVVIHSSKTSWLGREAILLKGKEYDHEYFDRMTLLPNQRLFETQAPELILSLREEGKKPVIIFADILRMKLFNAEYGFEKGDELIRETAKALESVFDNALIARLTDDHFCILTDASTIDVGMVLIEHKMKQMEMPVHVELKCGIYQFDENDDFAVTQMMDAAKMAAESIHDDMERQWRYYDAELKKGLNERTFIVSHIADAIENRELQVWNQPVVRTLTGKLAGFEALIRWNSPELGMLPPNRFISVLESSNQITLLDTFVVREVCRQYRENVKNGIDCVPVSFNLSRIDLLNEEICRIITEAAEEYDVPHEMLHVEITESVLTSNEMLMRERIREFHEAGFQVWMDDFGSGYSTLNSLKDFDFDVIKIDMKFLSSTSRKSELILRSTVAMAKAIGMETLAEGCETEEQFDLLARIGCEKTQGYLFGKPMPPEEGIKDLKTKDLHPESKDDMEFYLPAGMMQFDDAPEMAIAEIGNENPKLLYVGSEFEQVLDRIGIDSHDVIIEDLRGDEFLNRLASLTENGEETSVTFNMKDIYLISKMKLINRSGDRALVRLSVYNTELKAEAFQK